MGMFLSPSGSLNTLSYSQVFVLLKIMIYTFYTSLKYYLIFLFCLLFINYFTIVITYIFRKLTHASLALHEIVLIWSRISRLTGFSSVDLINMHPTKSSSQHSPLIPLPAHHSFSCHFKLLLELQLQLWPLSPVTAQGLLWMPCRHLQYRLFKGSLSLGWVLSYYPGSSSSLLVFHSRSLAS